MIKTIVIVVLVLLLIGNLFTYPLQHLFIFQPEELDPNFRFEFKQPFEEVNLPTPDGGNINALHFRVPKAKGVVLYFHGNADNLERWGQLHEDFRALGYDLFIMDYRGFGKSRGKLSQKNFYRDAEVCYEYIAKQYSAQEIIIFGRSMGSGPASYLAAQVEAQQLILETPFYSIKKLFYAYYPFLPRLFMFRFPFPNFKYLKKVNAPITIFHGDDDYVVPLSASIKLKEVLKPKDEYILIEGGSHSDLGTFEEYQNKLSELLE